jgi:tetratricopeptide (TPR) repeat protein
MRRTLELCEAAYGPEHSEVAIRLNNLASLLQDTNRLAEAEPLMRRALQIDEGSFGSQHPDVAIDLHNLARLLRDTERLAEAMPLIGRVVEIYEQSFGPDHPRTQNAQRTLSTFRQEIAAQSEPPASPAGAA